MGGGGGGQIHPYSSNIAYARFEVYKPFLRVFMSNFMVFMRKELWENVLVAIFLAGLPRARGTEPHTHGIWSTSFRLVVT